MGKADNRRALATEHGKMGGRPYKNPIKTGGLSDNNRGVSKTKPGANRGGNRNESSSSSSSSSSSKKERNSISSDSKNESDNTSSEKPSPEVKIIMECFNEICGTAYKATSRKTKSLIQARKNEGFKEDDFKTVIRKKYNGHHKNSLYQLVGVRKIPTPPGVTVQRRGRRAIEAKDRDSPGAKS